MADSSRPSARLTRFLFVAPRVCGVRTAAHASFPSGVTDARLHSATSFTSIRLDQGLAGGTVVSAPPAHPVAAGPCPAHNELLLLTGESRRPASRFPAGEQGVLLERGKHSG